MAELVKALKKDALEQDKIVALVADLLEQTVNRNDKMQVALCCENPGDKWITNPFF